MPQHAFAQPQGSPGGSRAPEKRSPGTGLPLIAGAEAPGEMGGWNMAPGPFSPSGALGMGAWASTSPT